MRKRKKKEKREAFTRQEWEREFGEPLFSAVMQKRWKEIFWSVAYCMFRGKINFVVYVCVLPVILLVLTIHFYDIAAHCKAVMAVFGVNRILDLILDIGIAGFIIAWFEYLSLFGLAVLAFCISIVFGIPSPKIFYELVFYAESCCVYQSGALFTYRFYMELEKIVILPADTWLIFEGGRPLLLPEHSITREQQKIIREYLKKKKPDVKIEKRKYF